MTKTELRRLLRKLLGEIPLDQRRKKSVHACHNLMQTLQFQSASTLMIYLSMDYEVDTADVIQRSWELSKTVAVPQIRPGDRFMRPVRIDSWDYEFFVSGSGLKNPLSNNIVNLEDIDLVVTPALGYDLAGNRLGHGGAYYDRFLAEPHLKAVTCGFAFSNQVVDFIPTCETDQPVDFLVTDKHVQCICRQISKGV